MTKINVKIIECETYSRVVGYYRPVQQWNAGKKAEFMARKFQQLAKPPATQEQK